MFRSLCLLSISSFLSVHAEDWRHEELRRFPAAEAVQGVAIDDEHFYAIANRAIGKYRKDTGERVALWQDEKDGRLRHLNAGVVLEGRLYCAHSNFPKLPEESSIEIWDTATMRHLESRPFEKPPGSLTWIDRRDGTWFACFAHYRSSGDPSKSRVVSYDGEWERLAEWSFPKALIERFAGYSASGGAFGPGGLLFVSGHDAKELYVLQLPAGGGELVWLATVPMSAAGQAFAWDQEGILYAIQRKTKEVVISRVYADASLSMPTRGFCAHRGAMATHPENTLPAFVEALRLGAGMIEFDVQLTRDGALVLMHDNTIDRTTDRQGRVADLTLSELREADAGIRKDASFAGTRIPTFEETLTMMPRNVWLNCHLKGGAELGAATAKVIVAAGRTHQAFLAAKADASRAAREVSPEILICNMERQSNAADYVRQTIAMKADFIQLLGKGEVDPALIHELHAAGVRVNYYSTATPEIARTLFAAGVDFPLVDDLAAFLPLARELGIAAPVN